MNEYCEAIAEKLNVKDYSKYIMLDDFDNNLEQLKQNISDISDSKNNLNIKEAINVSESFVAYNNNNNETINFGEENTITKQDNLLHTQNSEDTNNLMDIGLSPNIDEISTCIESSFNEITEDCDIYKEDDVQDNLDYNEVSEKEECDTLESCDETNEVSVSFDKDYFSTDDWKVSQNSFDLVGNKDISNLKENKKPKEKVFAKVIKNVKNMVWVSNKEVDTYYDEIALAKYCNLEVFKAENILRENEKLHISELKDSLIETFDTRNIGLKNKNHLHFIVF